MLSSRQHTEPTFESVIQFVVELAAEPTAKSADNSAAEWKEHQHCSQINY